jgi:siderophore synthetase component
LKDGGLSELLKDGTVHFLGPVGDRYRASQSVRTLMNAVHAEKANVKLAMNMSNTSSLRTIEPHSVCTAPVISDWLAGIVAQDSLFRERYPLAILSEYAGIVVDRDGPLAGQLAAIWRENVSTVLCEGQSATPFNALMTVEHDGKPFIEPWVRRHGLSDWVERLIDVAVMPVWHLLVGHGIATEAHGQNMVLVHEDGWPARLVLRDFHDSLEFVPDFLRDTTSAPDFDALDPAYRSTAPDQYYWMTSVECLRALTMDSLFVYNLSEVSHLLEECYGLPEATFWKSVGDRLRRYAREHGLEGRQSLLKHDAPEILTESLLARKLDPSAAEPFHKVPNMFAAAHQLCEA